MRNIGLIVIILQIISCTLFSQELNQVKIEKWKYGFAISESNNVLYYDDDKNSEKYLVTTFKLSKDEISKIKGDIIKNNFIQINGSRLRIDDRPKKSSGKGRNYQIINYKIENNSGYVSSDGTKWEKLKIKYLKETGQKDTRGYPIVYVYFECSFFKGEYQLMFGF